MPFSKIMVVLGTRPEAIKLAPVILALQRTPGLEVLTVSTSQHREMLDQVLDLFGILPEYDLQIMQTNQTLTQIVERSMMGLKRVFNRVRPEILLVQGDTTTAFCGALAAFYEKIPVGHIEAGLRTESIRSPFPEEANRRLIGVIASYHFAPTEGNRRNLVREHIDPDSIVVTGNTVIDALHHTLGTLARNPSLPLTGRFGGDGKKLILVTAHRRENFGRPLENICRALLQIADRHPDVEIVYPVHLNANVQRPVQALLAGTHRIHLLPPLDYREMCSLLNRSFLVLTDSGGLQEEAPSLGKPVVVMRSETERPEAVRAGTVAVVGTTTRAIVDKTEQLLVDDDAYRRMAHAVNPYGDGQAALRIVDFLTAERSLSTAAPALCAGAYPAPRIPVKSP